MDGVEIKGVVYICLECHPKGGNINEQKFYNEFIDWIIEKEYSFEGSTQLINIDNIDEYNEDEV